VLYKALLAVAEIPAFGSTSLVPRISQLDEMVKKFVEIDLDETDSEDEMLQTPPMTPLVQNIMN
jgi:hypothetical protein